MRVELTSRVTVVVIGVFAELTTGPLSVLCGTRSCITALPYLTSLSAKLKSL